MRARALTPAQPGEGQPPAHPGEAAVQGASQPEAQNPEGPLPAHGGVKGDLEGAS